MLYVFENVRNPHTFVRYWYEIRDILVPILQDVKFTKCEICGSTVHGGHLGHVTSIMSSDFHFLVPESFHKKFDSDWQSSF